jgi:hypothetical protein
MRLFLNLGSKLWKLGTVRDGERSISVLRLTGAGLLSYSRKA